MNMLASRRTSAAFSLVEVALALGVAGFCLITVFGLVPLGVNTGKLASDQIAASSILTHVLADLRATLRTPPSGAPVTSQEYGITIPANTAGGGATTAVRYFGGADKQLTFSQTPTSNARYRLTVNFLPTVNDRTATHVTLLVTWPAQIDPNNATTGASLNRVQVFAGLDRN